MYVLGVRGGGGGGGGIIDERDQHSVEDFLQVHFVTPFELQLCVLTAGIVLIHMSNTNRDCVVKCISWLWPVFGGKDLKLDIACELRNQILSYLPYFSQH